MAACPHLPCPALLAPQARVTAPPTGHVASVARSMLLPYLLAGLSESAVADYRAATYMIIGQLASRATFTAGLATSAGWKGKRVLAAAARQRGPAVLVAGSLVRCTHPPLAAVRHACGCTARTRIAASMIETLLIVTAPLGAAERQSPNSLYSLRRPALHAAPTRPACRTACRSAATPPPH